MRIGLRLRRLRTGGTLLTLFTLALVGVLATGCGTQTSSPTGAGSGASSSPTSSTSRPSTTSSTAQGTVVIHTKSVTVNGQASTVLADSKDLTLYYFTPDTASQIACTGACATNWPPLLSPSGTPSSSSSLPGTLTVLNGANGPQVLYNGHPLYTYAKDGDAGDAYGEGVGGKWHVATPDLAVQAA